MRHVWPCSSSFEVIFVPNPRSIVVWVVLLLECFALLNASPKPLRAQELKVSGDAPVSIHALTFESVGIAPQNCCTPDGLLVVRCNVKNTGEHPVSGFLIGRAVGNLGEEDRRRIDVPAHRTESYELHVRPPLEIPDKRVDVEVSLVALQDGQEVLVVHGSEPAVRRLSFTQPGKNPAVTAISMGREPLPPLDWRWETAEPFSTYELAIASRVDAELSTECISFETTPIPLNVSDWKCIDTYILSEPKVLEDAATLTALRAYLTSGGRIWIMLDDIDTDAVAPLLAENQQCTTVDTISLRQFVVDVPRSSISLADRSVAIQTPVRFKQVLQQGGEVTHWIDGWPAGLKMSVGRGELLLTTLDSAAWIRPRPNAAGGDPYSQSAYELRPWAKNLIDLVHVKRAMPLFNTSGMSYPLERIGNPIVPRSWVSGLLLLYCGVLIALGIWRFAAGELKWIGVAAPGLAVLASIPLVAIAWMQKRDIPPMVSMFQWAQFDDVQGGSLRESAAVYNSESRSMELHGAGGGSVVPDPAIQSGVKTITIDDFQQWRMSNIAWPAGVWRYTSDTTLSDVAMAARGRLTDRGIVLELPAGLPSNLKDCVLSYQPGAASLGTPEGPQQFLVDGSYPAEGERWTLDSMVDEEQSRRSVIYKKMFDSGDRLQVLSRTVVGWTDLFSSGPEWNVPLERRGAALVTMPVVIATPDVGTEVQIPYSLIRILNTELGDSSPIFMDAVGRWITQSSNKVATNLAFELPAEAAPLEVSSIAIDWSLQAPRRQVKLSSLHESNGELIPLATLDEPSLPWQQTLTDPRLLADLQDGRIVLKIEISDDREIGTPIPWRMQHLRMTVRGKTLPKNSLISGTSP